MNKLKAITQYFKTWYTLEKRLLHYLTFNITILSVLKSVLLVLFFYALPIIIMIQLFMFIHLHGILIISIIVLILTSIHIYYVFFSYFIAKKSEKIASLPLKKIFIVEKVILMILVILMSVWIIILTGVIL
jgi:hypothetical protein